MPSSLARRRALDSPSRSITSNARRSRPSGRAALLPALPLDPGRVAGPLALAELVLLDLARRRLRKLVDELHGPRGLVVGDLAADVLDQLVLAQVVSGPEHHEGLRTLAPMVVRHAHDGGLDHRVVGEDRLLDLHGRDVLPTGDDDVLGPVAKLDVAVGMHDPQVAGVEPAAAE